MISAGPGGFRRHRSGRRRVRSDCPGIAACISRNLNHAPLPPREWTVVLTWRNMESARPLTMGYGHAGHGRTIAVSNGSIDGLRLRGAWTNNRSVEWIDDGITSTR